MKMKSNQLNIVVDTFVNGKEAYAILAMAFIGGVTFATTGVLGLIKEIRKPKNINLINEEIKEESES